jgi:hypothetical protein
MIKKSIVLMGITFTLFSVILSGCNEQSNDNETTIDSDFFGTWKTELGNETWTFFENKTAKMITDIEEEPMITIFNWGTKEGNELCMNPQSNPNFKRCGIYEFTSTSFIWKINDNLNRTFYKVQ